MEKHGDDLGVENGAGCEAVVPDEITIEILSCFDDIFHKYLNIIMVKPCPL